MLTPDNRIMRTIIYKTYAYLISVAMKKRYNTHKNHLLLALIRNFTIKNLVKKCKKNGLRSVICVNKSQVEVDPCLTQSYKLRRPVIYKDDWLYECYI